MTAPRLSSYYEAEEMLPEEQRGFSPGAINSRHAVRRASTARTRGRAGTPPPVHALHRSPESGMTPSNEGCLWWVMLLIARFDVPEKMLNGIHHQFHEDLASELACGRMTASTRNGLTSLRGRGKDTYYHRFREVSSLRL